MNLFRRVYSLLMKASKSSSEYTVELVSNETLETETYTVKAASEVDAINIALQMASETNQAQDSSNNGNYMGLGLGLQHYKPRGFLQAITAPFAVWRDPVYKASLNTSIRSSTLKPGSFLASSRNSLTAGGRITGQNIDTQRIQKAINVNIVALLAWLGIFLLGILSGFISLKTYDNKSFVTLLPIIVCFFIATSTGIIGCITCRSNLKTLFNYDPNDRPDVKEIK